MHIERRYLRFDAETNALDYLEHSCDWLKQVETDETCWKWAIIALHGAVYGFAISACGGSNPENVMAQPQGKPFAYGRSEAHILSQISPDEATRQAAAEELVRREKWEAKGNSEHLLGFGSIIKRCQNPAYLPNPLKLTESQEYSLKFLNQELRNTLLHYPPMGWSLEIHGLPQIAIDSLQVVRFLTLESNAYLHLEEEQLSRIDVLTAETISVLEASELYIEAKRFDEEQAAYEPTQE